MMQAIALGALLGFLVALFCAVKLRWFARFRNGFGVMLAVALVGAGAMTAALLAGWGYDEAKHIVIDEQINSLAEIDSIAEQRLRQEVSLIVERLNNIADAALIARAQKDPAGTQELLQAVLTFNHCVLQFNVADRDGKLILASTRDAAKEPLNHVAAAFALEGKSYVSEPYYSPIFKRDILALSAPCEASDGSIAGLVTMRYDLQKAMQELVEGMKFGQSGYAIIADMKGRILAHPDAARLGEDVSSYPIFATAKSKDSSWLIAPNKAGVKRLFIGRQISSPATTGGDPVLLFSEIDAAEVMAPVIHMEKMFATAAGCVAIVWAFVALGLARLATRPLRDLLCVIGKVSAGDLSARSTVIGRDEIGRFADAFNEMIKGLAERDRVKKVFGRYVTTQVAERVLQAQGEQDLRGQRKRVTILFADIRNFTTTSEKMPPEQVVEFLNEYFSEMVDAVVEHGGSLDKFIGDGIMACFGSMDNAPDPEKRAVMAGLRMKARLAKLNGERAVQGKDPIHIGIGIHTDEVVVGNIGTKDRADFTVIGDGVNTCARVESANKEFGTTLLITRATFEKLGEGFECRAMPEAKLKGKTNIPPLFEVMSLRATPTAKAA